MKPYGLLSDQHCHIWSAFSSNNADGVNNRLQIILDEMERAAEETIVAGGDTLVFAGDLFHVRGKIEPEVFNPVHDMIEKILGKVPGFRFKAIPGNHDLAGKETTKLGNAMQTLGKLPGFTVVADTETFRDIGVSMIPWHSKLDELREQIEMIENREELDLIIHAPVNGVLFGIPDHGLSGEELAALGFRRVFSGHYHNHKEVVPGVFSIGATTHQTWSDIGTKAGFCLVYPDRVVFRASHAPNFVDIDMTTTAPEDIDLLVEGSYVRVKLEAATASELVQLRSELQGMGALGVVIHATPAAVTRTGSTVKTGTTIQASVAEYIGSIKHPRERDLQLVCGSILSEARTSA